MVSNGLKHSIPIIRLLSGPVTKLLLLTSLSANGVTFLSFLFGLSAALVLLDVHLIMGELIAAALFLVTYVLDNCDGEIARHKNQCSDFGAYFDTFVDWIVHSSFFAALGIRVSAMTGEDFWIWLGWAAAIGGTLNYVIGLIIDRRSKVRPAPSIDQTSQHPSTGREWLLFAFRELSRADFCFIVLVLAFFEALWLLLPAAAIGAQIYWITQFCEASRRFHV